MKDWLVIAFTALASAAGVFWLIYVITKRT